MKKYILIFVLCSLSFGARIAIDSSGLGTVATALTGWSGGGCRPESLTVAGLTAGDTA